MHAVPGFFRLERGTNALQIESGDCWCTLHVLSIYGVAHQRECPQFPALLKPYSAAVLQCCYRVAEPDFGVEDEVLSGRLHGSMVRGVVLVI